MRLRSVRGDEPLKKFDKLLDPVLRFLLSRSMFALLAGGTWQIFTRMILQNPSTVTESRRPAR